MSLQPGVFSSIGDSWLPGNPNSDVKAYGPLEHPFGGGNYDPFLIQFSPQKDFYIGNKRADGAISLTLQADGDFQPKFENQKSGAFLIFTGAILLMIIAKGN